MHELSEVLVGLSPMFLRLALVVLLLAGCDESDDREAHPIVLPPTKPSEERKSTGDVSPLTPIVLPDVAVPPPAKPAPPPPPPERAEPATPEAAQVLVAAPDDEKLVLPDVQKPPPPKKKKKR